MMYVLMLAGLLGCEALFGDGSDKDGDDSAGTDSAISTTDSGRPTGGDSATSLPDDEFCRESFSTAPPGGPDCQTATISCGQTLTGTTEGGLSQLGGDSYLDWFCEPTPDRYGGPERVYLLVLEGRAVAHINLDSPCTDLDLMVMHYGDEDTCPSPGAGISECEGAEQVGDDKVTVTAFERYAFYIVVDGKGGDTGNFRLSVECE